MDSSQSRIVKPVTNGCIFIPGRRYMVNIDTNVPYPYSEELMKCNTSLREFFPKFEDLKENDYGVEAKEGDIALDVKIEDVVQEIDFSSLTPAQKRRITMDNKKNIKIGV